MSLNSSWWVACLLAVGFTAVTGDTGAAAEMDPAPVELESAWSLKGTWTGVAGDETEGVIYGLASGGKCVELDAAGKPRREFAVPDAVGALRLGNWRGDGGKVLLTFRPWGQDLRAFDLEGKLLWTYQGGQAIDDAWATNPHGDKSGDVIVGYNGSDGLHVLDSKGELRWKITTIGNVWHVAAGDVWGEGTSQVVSTSAVGKVHVFGGDGKERKDLDAGCYANMVRVAKLSENDKAATVFVAGPGEDAKSATAVALTGDGARKWSLALPVGATAHVDSASVAPGAPWLAVGMRGGMVHVIDADNGVLIATTKGEGLAPEVGWVTRKPKGMPLLVVATGGKLNAFEVARAK